MGNSKSKTESGSVDARSGFLVQRAMCRTCIFRADSALDLDALLAEVADDYGGFSGHRICHHSDDACCAGFWANHKDQFALGQIAQRLNAVTFVEDDTLSSEAVRHGSDCPCDRCVYENIADHRYGYE